MWQFRSKAIELIWLENQCPIMRQFSSKVIECGNKINVLKCGNLAVKSLNVAVKINVLKMSLFKQLLTMEKKHYGN